MLRRHTGKALGIGILAIVCSLGGIAVGRLLVPRASGVPTSSASARAPAQVWTCSMHPQIRLTGPGDCPICGMPLIPAGGGSQESGGAPVLVLSEHARAMARVRTEVVERRPLDQEIRVVGLVEYNETAIATVTARVDGFVERLFVDYTGVYVNRGDHLVELYSPDLVAAQNELLVALAAGGSEDLVQSVRTKLLRWGILAEQIEELTRTRKAHERMSIFSPVQGTVIEKAVVEKSSVKAGDVLYRLVNLDSVWVNLDVYEFELSWIQYGQVVEISAEAFPGQRFEGRVVFISPIVDQASRTIKVRVNVSNHDSLLKPGMFVSARAIVPLRGDGRPAPTGVEGSYTCPMHPEVIQVTPGDCPKCSMPLVRIPAASTAGEDVLAITPSVPVTKFTCPMHPEVVQDGPGKCPKCKMNLDKVNVSSREDPPSQHPLSIPVSAVLDSGTRRMVFVERGTGEYEPIEVVLGPRTRDAYPVLSGLQEGDRVVVRGNFLLDSQAQIQGLPSLLRSVDSVPSMTATSSADTRAERRRSVEPGPSSDPHAGSAGSAGSGKAAPSPSTTSGKAP